MLCGVCIALWLVVDLWRVRRLELLKLEASERYMAREAQRLRVERKWALAVVTPGPKGTSSENRCAACGVAVPPDAKFCDSCGGVISDRCLKCGAANREGARFCKECGDPLPGTQGADSASRQS